MLPNSAFARRSKRRWRRKRGGADVPCYQRIVATRGESPDVTALTDAEREVVEQWQAAESAATVAAFGPHRYLEEGRFEIGV